MSSLIIHFEPKIRLVENHEKLNVSVLVILTATLGIQKMFSENSAETFFNENFCERFGQDKLRVFTIFLSEFYYERFGFLSLILPKRGIVHSKFLISQAAIVRLLQKSKSFLFR